MGPAAVAEQEHENIRESKCMENRQGVCQTLPQSLSNSVNTVRALTFPASIVSVIKKNIQMPDSLQVSDEITYQKILTCSKACCILGIHQWDHDCCYWIKLLKGEFPFQSPIESRYSFPVPRTIELAKVLSPNLPPTSRRVLPGSQRRWVPRSEHDLKQCKKTYLLRKGQ